MSGLMLARVGAPVKDKVTSRCDVIAGLDAGDEVEEGEAESGFWAKTQPTTRTTAKIRPTQDRMKGVRRETSRRASRRQIPLCSPGSMLFRDIYLTPPAPTGCGLIKVANGAGSTWTACCASR